MGGFAPHYTYSIFLLHILPGLTTYNQDFSTGDSGKITEIIKPEKDLQNTVSMLEFQRRSGRTLLFEFAKQEGKWLTRICVNFWESWK